MHPHDFDIAPLPPNTIHCPSYEALLRQLLQGGALPCQAMAEAEESAAGPAKDAPYRDRVDGDNAESFTSDDTQTGVKGIEAISQTWTRSSLIAAYLGSVICSFCFERQFFQLFTSLVGNRHCEVDSISCIVICLRSALPFSNHPTRFGNICSYNVGRYVTCHSFTCSKGDVLIIETVTVSSFLHSPHH